jgi:hypothetical protein
MFVKKGFAPVIDLYWDKSGETERVSSVEFDNLIKYELLWPMERSAPSWSELRDLPKRCDCDMCTHCSPEGVAIFQSDEDGGHHSSVSCDEENSDEVDSPTKEAEEVEETESKTSLVNVHGDNEV